MPPPKYIVNMYMMVRNFLGQKSILDSVNAAQTVSTILIMVPPTVYTMLLR